MPSDNTITTIVKYGTAVLTKPVDDGLGWVGNSGAIDRDILHAHAAIIEAHQGNVLIVSSGAVGMANGLIDPETLRTDAVTRKRLLAEMGQPRLFAAWQSGFKHTHVLQKLVTYADLRRQTMIKTMGAALDHGFIYICNFNDGVDDSELREYADHQFGDNDHLATELAIACTQLPSPTRLIINTSSHGLLSADTGETISELRSHDIDDGFITRHCKGISATGTGGMASKLTDICEALAGGVGEAWIVNGREPEQLNTILKGGHAGTRIIA